MDWFQLAQDSARWGGGDLVNTVMKFQVPKRRGIS
jgi:hypothetical protein